MRKYLSRAKETFVCHTPVFITCQSLVMNHAAMYSSIGKPNIPNSAEGVLPLSLSEPRISLIYTFSVAPPSDQIHGTKITAACLVL